MVGHPSAILLVTIRSMFDTEGETIGGRLCWSAGAVHTVEASPVA